MGSITRANLNTPRICKTLDWDEYPVSGKGAEKRKNMFMAEWSVVMKWDSEIRYSSIKPTLEDAKLMIEATQVILNALL